MGESSMQNKSGLGAAVSAELPMVLGMALGPMGLVAGAQVAALAGRQGFQLTDNNRLLLKLACMISLALHDGIEFQDLGHIIYFAP